MTRPNLPHLVDSLKKSRSSERHSLSLCYTILFSLCFIWPANVSFFVVWRAESNRIKNARSRTHAQCIPCINDFIVVIGVLYIQSLNFFRSHNISMSLPTLNKNIQITELAFRTLNTIKQNFFNGGQQVSKAAGCHFEVCLTIELAKQSFFSNLS